MPYMALFHPVDRSLDSEQRMNAIARNNRRREEKRREHEKKINVTMTMISPCGAILDTSLSAIDQRSSLNNQFNVKYPI